MYICLSQGRDVDVPFRNEMCCCLVLIFIADILQDQEQSMRPGELVQVISRGMANRKMGSHQMNMESSRSHSIATIYCECGGGDTGEIARFGKVGSF